MRALLTGFVFLLLPPFAVAAVPADVPPSYEQSGNEQLAITPPDLRNSDDKPADIEEAVAAFLYQEAMALEGDIQIQVAPVAADVRPTSCSEALQITLRQPISRHRHTVRVSCVEPQWQLHVSATVSIVREILVSQRAMTRKQVVSVNDLTLSAQDISLQSGDLLTSADEVAGMVLRRSVAAGTVLQRDDFEQPQLIRKGEAVTVVAMGSGVQVSAQGTALANARRDETLNVRNLTSGRMLQAVAVAPGRVEIRY